jgi:APA family basic amino acid/polyamine antiporter
VSRDAPAAATPSLTRALGTLDATLLTVGSVVGTGIFLTAGDVVRVLPHPWLALGVWTLGGLICLAGALAFAEMGAMFPRAGGAYHYLREAWGPLPAFLYGWTCLLVIMTGGIAAIAVGFGEYLVALVPELAPTPADGRGWSLSLPGGTWTVTAPQAIAAVAILLLTLANHFGVRSGATIQNLFTIAKLGAIGALVAFGLAAATRSEPAPWPAIAPAQLIVSVGVALVAVLWTFDGWYSPTFAAGELRDPARALPRALIVGLALVLVVYLALNWVYLKALPIAELAATPRAAEGAAMALLGAGAARWVAAAVSISAFGCLAATVLYSSRIYQPMAADGVFFRSVANIHPRWHTPVAALWLQGVWAVALALTGGYNALFTYVVFGGALFHVATGLALFRLRRMRPEAPRPYRAWGYPVVPALFALGMLLVTGSALWVAPRESLLGLGLIAAGLPAYAWWQRGATRHPPS